MITVCYLVLGIILGSYTLGKYWSRVPEHRHAALALLSLAVTVAWPGLAILALADKKLTVKDYVNQWLEISEDRSE